MISFFILVWFLIEIYIDYMKNRDIFKQDEKMNKEIQNGNGTISYKIDEDFCVESYSIIRKSKTMPYIEYIFLCILSIKCE